MNKTARAWASLVIALGVFGCGGGASAGPGASPENESSSGDEGDSVPNTAVRKTGGDSVSARLGSPGGSLELNVGPRVEIPPGAVEGAQEFVLKVAQKTTAFGNKESEKAVGPTFSFAPGVDAPDGRTVTVSMALPSLPDGWGDPAIAYEIDEGQVSYGEDSTRTKWQYEKAKLSGGRLVAELSGVTGLRMQFVLTNLEAQ